MMFRIRSAAAAAAIALSSALGVPAPAKAYPVDCAILLCLAGGWPASVPCTHARAVFIQRITPWPVEPPLQIWRCPMGVSLGTPEPVSPIERLYDIAFRDAPRPDLSYEPVPLVQVQASPQADIDIRGPAFDFVRSIRVFHIDFSRRRDREGHCDTSDNTRLGSYGTQGEFRWAASSVARVPPDSALPTIRGCNRVNYRAVFVDWRDQDGNYGFEEIRY